VVGPGFHIALSREHAKRLFAIKDDESLRQFLEELKSMPEMKKSGRILALGTAWDAIHRCLTDGELDPAGGEFPLNHAVLGGKQLHRARIRPPYGAAGHDAIHRRRPEELTEDDIRAKFLSLSRNRIGSRSTRSTSCRFDRALDAQRLLRGGSGEYGGSGLFGEVEA
jgi:hypothetical protein